MSYEFPKITHIDQVLAAIAGRDEFVVKHDEDGGYKVVNYLVNFADTFPEVTDERTALLRECRGIIFDAKSGKVIARRYHKFFNLGERPETQATRVDFTEPHVILEKLDGSMITPVIASGRKVRWGTKMGLTGVAAPVEAFVAQNTQYEDFAREMDRIGKTPIFEWCSRQQRIVIDYPVDRLVLTAVRCNVSGRYEPHEFLQEFGKNFEIEVVRALPGSVTNLQVFLDEVRDLKGAEGFVIRFETGHMLKVKSSEYIQMHGAKDSLSLEKNVVSILVNEKADDVKALLFEADFDRFETFETKFWEGVEKVSHDIVEIFSHNQCVDRRSFAVDYVQKQDPKYQRFLYQLWGSSGQVSDVIPLIIALIRSSCGTQTKINEVRWLWSGVKWIETIEE
jgi:T4 RnlA family RNA ligase